MYIVANSRMIKNKNYKQGNGKDKGKGAPQILEEEEIEGVDYQTLQTFQTEEEADAEAKKRIKENPHKEYLVFIAGKRYKTKEPVLECVDLI